MSESPSIEAAVAAAIAKGELVADAAPEVVETPAEPAAAPALDATEADDPQV